MVHSRTLERSYSLMAPFYDVLLRRLMARSRGQSIAALRLSASDRVLFCGIGTGLDLPHVPAGVHILGIDLTPAMLTRAFLAGRQSRHEIRLFLGDAEKLPFCDGAFDAVVLHLILAVVPSGREAFSEALRVARPGARLAVFDKFLMPGDEPSLLRRAASTLTRPLGTGLNLRLTDLVEGQSEVRILSNEPDLLGGFFRRILLHKVPPTPGEMN